MDAIFKVERVFFERYINELSSDAFKVLIRMLYLARETETDVEIKTNRSLRRVIGVNVAYSASVWNELIEAGLVNKKVRKGKIIYVLNSKRIRTDNTEFVEEKKELRNLTVTVYNIDRTTPEALVGLDDDIIRKKIKSTFENVSSELFEEIIKTVQLLKSYHVERDKRFRLSDLGKFLVGLVKYDNHVVKEVCYRYNNDSKIAGMRGLRYVLRMAQGINLDKKNIAGDTEDDKKIVEDRKIEGEQKFAIKLATGNVDASVIYKRLLKNQEYGKLTDFWHKGVSSLVDAKREDEIFKEYGWLKNISEKQYTK